MSASHFLITVGIPTFDRNEVLTETISQLLAIIDPSSTEIIVADQTPLHDPSTLAKLEAWSREGRIRWLACQPPSLTAARNLILREARADVVLFLDDDVIIPADLIERHVECYAADSRLDAVAGEVFHCHDPARPATLDSPSAGATAHFATRCQPGPINEMVGAHHSVRKDAAIAVGGYDEALIGPAYCEDTDMALRLTLGGRRLEYHPRAWVIHLKSPSGGCRIPGSATHPEWSKSANFLVFALRHRRNHWGWRWALWASLRAGPFRRENVVNPLRWPLAWWSWLQALVYAFRNRRFHAEEGRFSKSQLQNADR